MIKAEELSNPASCMSRARDDEMTFVLLGRDVAAPVAIRAWIDERIRLGKNKPGDEQIIKARRCAEAMGNGKGAEPQGNPPCPICRVEMRRILYVVSYFTLWQCPECKTVEATRNAE